MAAGHEARIHELDRALAPGSETALLGDALDSIRRTSDPDADLAWWVGAYRLLEWARDNRERWELHYAYDVWGSPEEQILTSGDDWTGWVPPTPRPEDLRVWRDSEGLTQERAAKLAGVELRAWQRWESGERSVPQWLGDTLRQRWGSAP